MRTRKRFTSIGIVAVVMVLMAWGKVPSAAASTHLTLQLSPHRVALGHQFAVILTGARPGARIDFVERPLDITGFGGGIMGERRANGHGVIRFVYPAGKYSWEVGRWRITAGYRASAGAVSAVINVVY
jgi:hypothetical protein